MAEMYFALSEQQKTAIAERLWLLYFNRCLYEKGILTEAERNRMITKIENRKLSSRSKKEL